MGWQTRAQLLKLMASTSATYACYQRLQRVVGDVSKPRFWLSRWRAQTKLLRRQLNHGFQVQGKTLLEVGTGWVPSVPLGFFLCGAERIYSFDTNRHFLPTLLQNQLEWLGSHDSEVNQLWGELVPQNVLRERLGIIRALAHSPRQFLDEAGIELRAPSDASQTSLSAESIDGHYSNNVLEHIPEPALRGILEEARRVLRPSGVAVHFIDVSDHFARHDSTISNVNFLQYSPKRWQSIAGNRLAYHNRLREPQFTRLFRESRLEVLEAYYDINQRALDALRGGLPVAACFAGMSPEELARMPLRYVCRKPAT